jgi:hypothetical protein
VSEAPPKRRRIGAFAIGLLIGFIPPALIAGWVRLSINSDLWQPEYTVELVTRGAEAASHGVARITARDSRGNRVEQICRGRCDDLLVQIPSSDNAFVLTVQDVAGRQLAVGALDYVSGGLGSNVWRLTVGGSDRLAVRETWIDWDQGRWSETSEP